MVRAKMTLQAVTEYPGGMKCLKFYTQYDPSLPEDQRFSKATQSGSIEMHVDNPKALEQFKLGEAYYVDFSPAPAAK